MDLTTNRHLHSEVLLIIFEQIYKSKGATLH